MTVVLWMTLNISTSHPHTHTHTCNEVSSDGAEVCSSVLHWTGMTFTLRQRSKQINRRDRGEEWELTKTCSHSSLLYSIIWIFLYTYIIVLPNTGCIHRVSLRVPDKLAAYFPLLHFPLCHQGCTSIERASAPTIWGVQTAPRWSDDRRRSSRKLMVV